MLVMQIFSESPPPRFAPFPAPAPGKASFQSLVPRPLTPCFLLLDTLGLISFE